MVIVEIDDKSPQAKKVIELLNTFEFVNVVNKNVSAKNGKHNVKKEEGVSPYNPEFVKMVKQADKGKRIKLNTSNIWESILSK